MRCSQEDRDPRQALRAVIWERHPCVNQQRGRGIRGGLRSCPLRHRRSVRAGRLWWEGRWECVCAYTHTHTSTVQGWGLKGLTLSCLKFFWCNQRMQDMLLLPRRMKLCGSSCCCCWSGGLSVPAAENSPLYLLQHILCGTRRRGLVACVCAFTCARCCFKCGRCVCVCVCAAIHVDYLGG